MNTSSRSTSHQTRMGKPATGCLTKAPGQSTAPKVASRGRPRPPPLYDDRSFYSRPAYPMHYYPPPMGHYPSGPSPMARHHGSVRFHAPSGPSPMARYHGRPSASPAPLLHYPSPMARLHDTSVESGSFYYDPRFVYPTSSVTHSTTYSEDEQDDDGSVLLGPDTTHEILGALDAQSAQEQDEEANLDEDLAIEDVVHQPAPALCLTPRFLASKRSRKGRDEEEEETADDMVQSTDSLDQILENSNNSLLQRTPPADPEEQTDAHREGDDENNNTTNNQRPTRRSKRTDKNHAGETTGVQNGGRKARAGSPSRSASNADSAEEDPLLSQPVDSARGKREYSLSNWTIKPIDHIKQVIVEGMKAGTGEEVQWRSTAIKLALDKRTLQTTSGSVYKLLGPLDAEMAEHYGLSTSMCKAFKNGFPTNWKSLLAKYFKGKECEEIGSETTVNVSKKIRRKTNTNKERPVPEIRNGPSPGNTLDLSTCERTRSGRVVVPSSAVAWWKGVRLYTTPKTELQIRVDTPLVNQLDSPLAWPLTGGAKTTFRTPSSTLLKRTPHTSKSKLANSRSSTTINSDMETPKGVPSKRSRAVRKEVGRKTAAFIKSSDSADQSLTDTSAEPVHKPQRKVAKRAAGRRRAQTSNSVVQIPDTVVKKPKDKIDNRADKITSSEISNKNNDRSDDQDFVSSKGDGDNNRNNEIATSINLVKSPYTYQGRSSRRQKSRSSSGSNDKFRQLFKENDTTQKTVSDTELLRKVGAVGRRHHTDVSGTGTNGLKNPDSNSTESLITTRTRTRNVQNTERVDQTVPKNRTQPRVVLDDIRRSEEPDVKNPEPKRQLRNRKATKPTYREGSETEECSRSRPKRGGNHGAITVEGQKKTSRTRKQSESETESEQPRTRGRNRSRKLSESERSEASTSRSRSRATSSRVTKPSRQKSQVVKPKAKPKSSAKLVSESGSDSESKPAKRTNQKATKTTKNKAEEAVPEEQSDDESDTENEIFAARNRIKQKQDATNRTINRSLGLNRSVKRRQKRPSDVTLNVDTVNDYGETETVTWHDDEVARFRQAIGTVPASSDDYWSRVADITQTKSADQCRAFHLRDVPNDVKKRDVHKPAPVVPKIIRDANSDTVRVELQGGKGTFKRKRQMQTLIDHFNQDFDNDYFDSTPWARKHRRIELPSDTSETPLPKYNNSVNTPCTRLALQPRSERKTPVSSFISPGVAGSKEGDDLYIHRCVQKLRGKIGKSSASTTSTSTSDRVTPKRKKPSSGLQKETRIIMELTQDNKDNEENESGEEEDDYFSSDGEK